MQSSREELANIVTHAAGAACAVAVAVVMIVRAATGGSGAVIATIGTFSATLIAMYLASTLYHAAAHAELRGSTPRRARLRKLAHTADHIAIYLLIAGTYTPFMIVALGGAWGWSIFGVVWGIASAGVVFKLFATGRFRLLSTLAYVAMGWLVVIAAGEMWRSMSVPGIAWLVAGGLAYTVGAVVYSLRRIRYHHAIWHLFVVAGSACHIVAMWYDVLRPA